ncbi:hypothetical protein K435DRAFT_871345 [Dendrothele bispora CBS 962.96]|uniref:Uncharacterized protein n=1 Tax=Dendrothele bispora (strain CBS 962.96) TaxID=1314807 RepID=A0A4S8L4V6_DENBC|nr:hypothetical protein K435DRAFT_871345 [Dendrothele bispora CBS 962.96]
MSWDSSSFESYCDLSRQFDPVSSPATLEDGTVIPPWTGLGIETFVKAVGWDDLLDFVEKYCINQGAPTSISGLMKYSFYNNVFHFCVNLSLSQFSKHATYTSTFAVTCYGPSYKEHEDVVKSQYLRITDFPELIQCLVAFAN